MAESAAARIAIMTQLGHERDAAVRGMLAESLGRLPETDPAQLAANAAVLAGLVGTGAAPGSTAADARTLRGVARGMFFLTRVRASRGAIADSVKTAACDNWSRSDDMGHSRIRVSRLTSGCSRRPH